MFLALSARKEAKKVLEQKNKKMVPRVPKETPQVYSRYAITFIYILVAPIMNFILYYDDAQIIKLFEIRYNLY